MTEVATLAGAFASYGIYAITALLVVAVCYLFKEINHCNKSIQDVLREKNNDYKELLLKTTIAIENSTKVVERVEKILDK